MRQVILVLLAFLFAIPEAEARWRWPWEFGWHHPRQARKHPRRTQAPREEKRIPDCKEIIDALKVLPPEKQVRALNSSSKEQRRTIADCLEKERGQ